MFKHEDTELLSSHYDGEDLICEFNKMSYLRYLMKNNDKHIDISSCPMDFLEDNDICAHLVCRDRSVYTRLPKNIREDANLCTKLVRNDSTIYHMLAPCMRYDRNVCNAAVYTDHMLYQQLPIEMQNDPELCSFAIRMNSDPADLFFRISPP